MDLALLRAANGLLAGPTRPLWEWLGSDAAAVVLAIAIVGYALWKRRWAWIVAGGLAVALTDPLCARVLKPAIARDRPCRTIPDLPTLRDCGAGLAMPSVHAANAAALAAATGSPVLFAVALLAGASRVVQGQHWPSDVVVGWIVGGAIGAGVGIGTRTAMRRLCQRRGREGPLEGPWT
ncbi:MAG: phosphatase PAP2 family protein [Pseudomonadota bacterium]|nr:phosphatase PAP2 family protein [Pseudomonadota bacterium]